jgi:CDP-glucose 4,6-dehydratase
MNPRFWKDKRVFITGHTGFKGSWLSLWLQRLSAEVTGYALPAPTQPSLFEAARAGSGMESIVGDVRDYRQLRDSLEKHRPEIVFHMAAQSIVRLSYEDPIDTYSTNVMGTVHVLEAVRRLPGRTVVVNVTSDKSYENKEWIWGYRETDRLGGFDPYSNSKACSELVTQSFRDSFWPATSGAAPDKLIATARGGNVIGGGDWTRDQLVPDVVNAVREGCPVVLRNPKATRPWQFVLDCLGGYMALAEKLCVAGAGYCGAWNFGPRQEDTLSVQEVVEKLIQEWPGKAGWVLDSRSHPHEAHSLRLDTSKTTLHLGWMPRLPAAEALEWIVDWYKKYFQGTDARALCLEQIERFENKAPAP